MTKLRIAASGRLRIRSRRRRVHGLLRRIPGGRGLVFERRQRHELSLDLNARRCPGSRTRLDCSRLGGIPRFLGCAGLVLGGWQRYGLSWIRGFGGLRLGVWRRHGLLFGLRTSRFLPGSIPPDEGMPPAADQRRRGRRVELQRAHLSPNHRQGIGESKHRSEKNDAQRRRADSAAQGPSFLRQPSGDRTLAVGRRRKTKARRCCELPLFPLDSVFAQVSGILPRLFYVQN